MADLDGNGHPDVISGSYWPGDLYLFRGEGNGAYRKGEILQDRDGKNVNAGPAWQNKNKPEMDSLAASPWLVDFDADGDLDLLVGNIAGHVVLIQNEGDAEHPAFVRKDRLQADGADIMVGGGDAGPTTVDWDGDGRWDLIVGAGDGSVIWYRNVGSAAQPAFAKGAALVRAKAGNWQIAHGEEPERSGMRAKVHCTDWNGDGHLDLLVGDFLSIAQPEPELTADQQKQREVLIEERDALNKQMQPLWQKESEDKLTEADREQMKAMQERFSKVYQELRPLEAQSTPAGWVWVYLRRAPDRDN